MKAINVNDNEIFNYDNRARHSHQMKTAIKYEQITRKSILKSVCKSGKFMKVDKINNVINWLYLKQSNNPEMEYIDTCAMHDLRNRVPCQKEIIINIKKLSFECKNLG